MASDQIFGTTPPMSVALPTESEKRASDALIEELRRQKTFEKPSDTEKRYTSKGLDLLTIVVNTSLCSNESPQALVLFF